MWLCYIFYILGQAIKKKILNQAKKQNNKKKSIEKHLECLRQFSKTF